jgi:hypothetical protein
MLSRFAAASAGGAPAGAVPFAWLRTAARMSSTREFIVDLLFQREDVCDLDDEPLFRCDG